MNPTLNEFSKLFWITFVASVATATFSYVLIWRKDLFLRFLDAEESFWLRFRIPKGGLTRRFAESRFFAVSIVVLTVAFLIEAGLCAGAYFHFLHRLQNQKSNQSQDAPLVSVFASTFAAPLMDTNSNADTKDSPRHIQIRDLPITTAIKNLAQLSGINYSLDSKIGYGKEDETGQIIREPSMSVNYENVTAGQVLHALLDNYGLQLVENPQTGIALITVKNPNGENVAVQSVPLPVSTNDSRGIIIRFEDIPLMAAVDSLARQAGINYMLDPKIGYGQPDQYGQIKPEPVLTIRWENISAQKALLALLDKYGLQLIYDPKTTIARITTKNPEAHQ